MQLSFAEELLEVLQAEEASLTLWRTCERRWAGPEAAAGRAGEADHRLLCGRAELPARARVTCYCPAKQRPCPDNPCPGVKFIPNLVPIITSGVVVHHQL